MQDGNNSHRKNFSFPRETEKEKVIVIGVDPWGRFLRSDLQSAFVKFCLEQRNITYTSVVILLITIWAFLETIATIVLNGDSDNLYFSIPVLFIILLTWITLILMQATSWIDGKNEQFWQTLEFQGNLQSILIVLTFSIVILKVLEQLSGTNFICQPSMGLHSRLDTEVHSESNDIPGCPSPGNFLSIVSPDMILVMCFCPMLLSPLFYEPKYYLIIILQLITGFLAVYAVVDSFYSVIPLIVVLVAIGLSGYELHRQRMKSFLDRNQLKEMLREREENADRLHALEMRSMIGNVAHDLKTPLSSFTTGMDLIQEVVESAKKKVPIDNPLFHTFVECLASIQGYLDNIRNTNSFMLMTINRCIDYTKASKGMKLVPRNETLCLREVLEFPIDCMRNIQERIGIKLEPLAKEICSHIITDKQWLQENLLCLLSNAVKYSSEGEVTIEVSLVVEKPIFVHCVSAVTTPKQGSSSQSDSDKTVKSGYLLFEIEDNGIGISEEVMKSLFSPFKQAQRMAGGTGLGLYSLARRLEALHGSYGVNNRRDGEKGTLFWFAIPYRPDTTVEVPKDTVVPVSSLSKLPLPDTPLQVSAPSLKADPHGRSATESPSLEILVVDDSPSILKMSSMMLKRQGHKIWTAENGAIALKQIEEKWKETGRGYDLVLMDLQMPVMDGFEATRRLRSLEATATNGVEVVHRKQQLVIGVSANSDHETMKDALSVGFDEFLCKPFTAEDLIAVLRKHLSLRVSN